MFSPLLSLRVLFAPLLAAGLGGAPVDPPSPVVPPSAEVSTASYYWARIDNIWSEYDIWQNSQMGMVIHVKFRIGGLRGVPCNAVAYFAFSDGQQLDDYDGLYTTTDGQVSAARNFTPSYDEANFENLQIFIPYNQLHMSVGRHNLQYHVELHTSYSGAHIASSSAVGFQFTQN